MVDLADIKVLSKDKYNALATKPQDTLHFVELSMDAYIVESFRDGFSWYRVYSDGWCEQGGRCNGVAYNDGTKNVTFLKSFRDINYFAVASPISDASNDGAYTIACRVAGFTRTNMTVRGGINAQSAWTGQCSWQACGYIE